VIRSEHQDLIPLEETRTPALTIVTMLVSDTPGACRRLGARFR